MEGNIEQQVSSLEKQIEERKTQTEQREAGEQASEKEIVHSIVGEQIQQHAPMHQIKSNSSSGLMYQDPRLQPLVQDLVNIAFSKSIPDAVKAAVKSNNPALIDAFHDILVDELYAQLLERRKLKEIK